MKFRDTLNYFYISAIVFVLFSCQDSSNIPNQLVVNDQEYFEMPGLNVMVYHDYYPIGRQGGITIIQNGERVASNGDIRLTNLRRPFPANGKRIIDNEKNTISVDVGFPDSLRAQHKDPRYPFPDINIKSKIHIKGEGASVRITIDLDKPLPREWENKVEFRLELFPGHFFDKTYYMDALQVHFLARQMDLLFKTAMVQSILLL